MEDNECKKEGDGEEDSGEDKRQIPHNVNQLFSIKSVRVLLEIWLTLTNQDMLHDFQIFSNYCFHIRTRF